MTKPDTLLTRELVENLDGFHDENVEAPWNAEIARRLRDIDSGKVKTVPWGEARREILRDQ